MFVAIAVRLGRTLLIKGMPDGILRSFHGLSGVVWEKVVARDGFSKSCGPWLERLGRFCFPHAPENSMKPEWLGDQVNLDIFLL